MANHGTGSGDDDNCGYHSVFHGGHNEILFFPDLQISSEHQLVGACVVVFLMALMNEGMRLFLSWLQGQGDSRSQHQHAASQLPQHLERPTWAVVGLVHTLGHVLHLFLHYCLMIVFMALNVWLCLALLLGAAAGFLLFHFRPVKSRVFRFLGVREQAGSGKGPEDKENFAAEMSDMTSDDYKWNGATKGK
ncbi:high affinity copper uptake protein 1-like [Babylonia areolata]|uniref:high affinity copper uptake protein 1-like n=1 Tax=Babylonia areolata TaxID=304850 RepID=UPI003FD0DEF9